MAQCEVIKFAMELDNETAAYYGELYWRFIEFHHDFRPIHRYLCVILCTLGIVANALTIVVLTRRRMKSTANRILTLIAICDFSLMVSYLIYLVYSRYLTFSCEAEEFSYPWMVFTLFHAFVSVYTKACSLWLAVILAGYRKHLLTLTQLEPNTSANVIRIIIFCFVAVFALCVPMMFNHNIVRYVVPEDQLGTCSNGTIYYLIEPYPLALAYDCLLMKFNFWASGLLCKFLACGCLAYFLTWIIYLMINRAKMRSKRFNQARKTSVYRRSVKTTQRTTLILTLVLSLSLICETPCAVVSVLSGVLPTAFYQYVYRNLGDFFDALSLLNGIMTFPLYCFMSSGFRVTFLNMFCRLCRKKPPGDSLLLQSNNGRTSMQLKTNLMTSLR